MKPPTAHVVALGLAVFGWALVLLSLTPGVPWPGGPPAKATSNAKPNSPPGPAEAPLLRVFGPDFDTRSAFCAFAHPRESVVDGVLTVRYPAGSAAQSEGPPYGGGQICLPFAAGTARTAALSYQVRFPVGFQFVKGGKLPGVYGGKEPFSGGDHNSNGWSARLMWRTGGAAEIYAYTATTTGYGDEYGKGNFTWQADGKWHDVTVTVTLNSPGATDGSITLAYDGTTRIAQNNLSITTTDTPISGLFFSTFYGGDDKSWAPPADMSIDFKDFSTSVK